MSEPPESSQAARTWATGTLAALPVLVIGVLYFVRAVIETARLRHAGLNVADTLPLFPVQNALAVGMAAMVSWKVLVVLAVLLGLAWLIHAAGEAVRHLAAESAQVREMPRAGDGVPLVVLAILIAILIGLLGVLIALDNLREAVADFGGLLSTVVILVLVSSPRGRRPPLWIIATLLLLLPMGVRATLQEELEPSPLPIASIRTVANQTIRGPLIVISGGTWFIALPGKPSGSRAVPPSEIRGATVLAQKSTRDRSYYRRYRLNRLFDWIPFTWVSHAPQTRLAR